MQRRLEATLMRTARASAIREVTRRQAASVQLHVSSAPILRALAWDAVLIISIFFVLRLLFSIARIFQLNNT
jgi:hypothetical protein